MSRRPSLRLEEQTRLPLAGGEVDCLVRRSTARRTLALRIDVRGRIVVNVPLHAQDEVIGCFVARHADWLHRQLLRVRNDQPSWQLGRPLPYLGGWLELAAAAPGQVTQRIGDRLLIDGQAPIAGQVLGWYREEARTVLGQRLAVVCRSLGRCEPSWRLSDACTRWGYLSAKGVMGLNWRLIKAGPAEIDYVICHELAHQRQRNHSPAFWREVAALRPGFAAERARLRSMGRLYFQF